MPRIKKIGELRQELAAKEKQLGKLMAQRKKLASTLESIDRVIALLGGEIPPTRRRPGRPPGRPKVAKKRAKRGRKPLKRGRKPKRIKKAKKVKRGRRATGKPLADYLKQVLSKAEGPMRAKDIVPAVRKTEYKTFSKDFYGIVATALRDKKTFKRVSRGVYTLVK
jgi:hypothetical protein